MIEHASLEACRVWKMNQPVPLGERIGNERGSQRRAGWQMIGRAVVYAYLDTNDTAIAGRVTACTTDLAEDEVDAHGSGGSVVVGSEPVTNAAAWTHPYLQIGERFGCPARAKGVRARHSRIVPARSFLTRSVVGECPKRDEQHDGADGPN